jgi:hypothetical protein
MSNLVHKPLAPLCAWVQIHEFSIIPYNRKWRILIVKPPKHTTTINKIQTVPNPFCDSRNEDTAILVKFTTIDEGLKQ